MAARLSVEVLVVADTQANRLAMDGGEATLTGAFPIGHRAVMGALRAGRLPPGNGLAVI